MATPRKGARRAQTGGQYEAGGAQRLPHRRGQIPHLARNGGLSGGRGSHAAGAISQRNVQNRSVPRRTIDPLATREGSSFWCREPTPHSVPTQNAPEKSPRRTTFPLCRGLSAVPNCPKKTRKSAGSAKNLHSFQMVETGWRRRRDSNPRYGFPYDALAKRWFQPLTHVSGSRREAGL